MKFLGKSLQNHGLPKEVITGFSIVRQIENGEHWGQRFRVRQDTRLTCPGTKGFNISASLEIQREFQEFDCSADAAQSLWLIPFLMR